MSSRILFEHAQDPFRHLNPGASILDLPRSLHSVAETLIVHRLEQIIQSMNFEGACCS
jgi:hypothetical protein